MNELHKTYMSLKAYYLNLKYDQIGGKSIKLSDIKVIQKIGSFMVDDVVVIGDTDYAEIPLTNGMYNAYRVDDNLLIAKQDIEINKQITKWTWKYSGEGVGVDSGQFGFYNKKIIDEINRKSGAKINDMPMFNNDKDYAIIKESNIDKSERVASRTNRKIGVIGTTVTGDGFFDCYIIDHDGAILLGGLTSQKYKPNT
jgi:hypothetical protein